MSEYRRGLLMALGTSLLWGAMSPIAKIVSSEGLNQFSSLAYRALVVTVSVASLLLFRRETGRLRISGRLCGIYCSLGIVGFLMAAGGFLVSCVYLTVPQAITLHYAFPLVTMLGDVFVTKERPNRRQVFGGFLLLFGLYVGFLWKGNALAGISVPGLVWGTLSVLGLASQNVITRRMVRDGESDPIVQLFYTHLFGGLILVASKSVLMGWGDLSGLSPRIFLWMQYPAFGAGLLGFGLLFSSLRYIPATTASMICGLEIVIAIAVMPLLIGAVPTTHEAAGALIVFVAVVVSAMPARKR